MSKHRRNLYFVIDSDESVDPIVLEAVDQGRPWNGWRTPIVTLPQFAEWVELWSKSIGLTMHVFISSDSGNLVLVDLSQCRVEEWSPVTDGWVDGEPVFQIDGWVWCEYVEPQHVTFYVTEHPRIDGAWSVMRQECVDAMRLEPIAGSDVEWDTPYFSEEEALKQAERRRREAYANETQGES